MGICFARSSAAAAAPCVGFVGYDPVLDEVIVSHQGTDTTKM